MAKHSVNDLLDFPHGLINKTNLENYIEARAREQAYKVIADYVEALALLLDHFGLEVDEGKRIVKVKKGKK